MSEEFGDTFKIMTIDKSDFFDLLISYWSTLKAKDIKTTQKNLDASKSFFGGILRKFKMDKF